MRYFAVFTLGFALALTGSSVALDAQLQADGSLFIKLSPEEAKACDLGGGCCVVPQRALQAVLSKCGIAI